MSFSVHGSAQPGECVTLIGAELRGSMLNRLSLLLLLFALGACAPSYGHGPQKRGDHKATADPAPKKKAVDPTKGVIVEGSVDTLPPRPKDLSEIGTPIALGEIVDAKGYQTYWVAGTRLLITLKTTKWNEVGDGLREGRATLIWEIDRKTKTKTVDESTTEASMGYAVEVKYAYEHYDDTRGVWQPHAKFRVTKAN
jgi:hypothetical protein